MTLEEILETIEGFDWDLWNVVKNVEKHGVENKEAEDVFFNKPHLVEVDEKHSTAEMRYRVLGGTDSGRRLMIVFTVRKRKIRIISARDQSRKEKLIFEKLKNEET